MKIQCISSQVNPVNVGGLSANDNEPVGFNLPTDCLFYDFRFTGVLVSASSRTRFYLLIDSCVYYLTGPSDSVVSSVDWRLSVPYIEGVVYSQPVRVSYSVLPITTDGVNVLSLPLSGAVSSGSLVYRRFIRV